VRKFLNRFWNDDAGFIVSAELLFLYTIAVLGLLTGMVAIRNAVIHEMVDVADSIGALDQSFTFKGLSGCAGNNTTAGSAFDNSGNSINAILNITSTNPLNAQVGTQAACP
jgi:hypothetical protein